MTAPAPSPYLSPTAGLLNALCRLAIARLDVHIAGLERLLGEARELNHELRTSRDFAASDAAGYIDHPYRTQGGTQ